MFYIIINLYFLTYFFCVSLQKISPKKKKKKFFFFLIKKNFSKKKKKKIFFFFNLYNFVNPNPTNQFKNLY